MITALYASILAIMYFRLSIMVIACRRRHKIALGHGDCKELEQAMRVQANFMEYTPIMILLILLVELQGGYAIIVHLLGLAYIVGRVIHAYGLGRYEKYENNILITSTKFRKLGMQITFNLILGAAVINIVLYVMQVMGYAS